MGITRVRGYSYAGRQLGTRENRENMSLAFSFTLLRIVGSDTNRNTAEGEKHAELERAFYFNLTNYI